jgi:G3E family GTPase
VIKKMTSTPFSVITGFLGSGKTTLLNALLRKPGMGDTAVLVNEFGEIGLDQWLIEPIADDIVLLESGCVCCSVRDDLSASLASLLARRRAGIVPAFRRIVLETTGIADPGPIVQLVLGDKLLGAEIHLAGVTTVVDAVLGERSLETHGECAAQVAMADRLVLSKLDLAEHDQVASLRKQLQAINSLAPITSSDLDAWEVDDFFRLNEACIASRASNCPARGRHAGRFTTFVLAWESPVDWPDVEAWLDGLLSARGEDILRLKGLLNVAGRDRPVVVQGVQHTLYQPAELECWPREAPRSELVFITRDFPQAAALRSVEPFFDLSGARGS